MQATSYPRNKLKILLLENINAEALNAFHNHGYTNIKAIHAALSEKELINEIKNVHILGIRSKTQITDNVLSHASKLLAIGCFCIGTNQVDLVAARKNGVAVFNAPYSNTRSVAELVIGAMIMLIRKIPEKNRLAHEGIWKKESASCHELRGKTLGILGYGNIGSQVSVLAESLGLKVVFYDIQKKLPLGNARAVSNPEELFGMSDIVTIHMPATAQTLDLINRKTLKKFKKGSILINYARGEVVDPDAVKWAMEQGMLSGVALDVYKQEPEKNGDAFPCALQGMDNVLLTPHIGGSTEEAQANIGVDVSSKLVDFIEYGSTTGSHTIPSLDLSAMERTHRILHIHKNVPGVLSAINTQLSKSGINILAQYLKTNEEIGYVVLDVDAEISKKAQEMLRDVKGTIRIRLLY